MSAPRHDMTRHLCALIPLGLFLAACTMAAVPDDTDDAAAVINNCLDDNTARQCRAFYPEYSEDAQLQEELAAQAEQCGTRTDNECEE